MSIQIFAEFSWIIAGSMFALLLSSVCMLLITATIKATFSIIAVKLKKWKGDE